MKTLKLSVLFLVASLTVSAQNVNRKIIGADNQRVVNATGSNIPFKYHPAMEAVGMISMGCTATHIGYGLVLTAGHCFDASKIKFKKPCVGEQVFWGVREGKSPSLVSNCKQLLVVEHTKSRDYALFLVDKAPRVALPVKLDGRAALSTRITIFSHPFKQPLTWSGVCEVRKSFTAQIPLGMIHHQCDTNPGSSGAAILDANTLEVIGIHDGGWAEGVSGYNYGSYIDATYIPTILARMGYRRPN